MHSRTKTKPHTEYEMLMLRHGWNPRCELLERKVTQLEGSHVVRTNLMCKLCAHLAAVLHYAARRLEKFEAGQEVT